jgi:hypothetical protein
MFQKLFLGSMGFEPMTTTNPNNLRNGSLPMRHIISYVIKPTILNILYGIMAHKGEGWGLSPNPWSCKPPYEQEQRACANEGG